MPPAIKLAALAQALQPATQTLAGAPGVPVLFVELTLPPLAIILVLVKPNLEFVQFQNVHQFVTPTSGVVGVLVLQFVLVILALNQELINVIQPNPKAVAAPQIAVVAPGTHGALVATVAAGAPGLGRIIVVTPKQNPAMFGKTTATAVIPMPGVPGALAQAPVMALNLELMTVTQLNINPATLAPVLAQHKLLPPQ